MPELGLSSREFRSARDGEGIVKLPCCWSHRQESFSSGGVDGGKNVAWIDDAETMDEGCEDEQEL